MSEVIALIAFAIAFPLLTFVSLRARPDLRIDAKAGLRLLGPAISAVMFAVATWRLANLVEWLL
jgi:hypothetical protein